MSWLQALEFTPPAPPQPKKPMRMKRRREYRQPVGHPGRGGREVTIDGVWYPTQSAAAGALGVSKWAVRRTLGFKK
jgi:hypothetical protein